MSEDLKKAIEQAEGCADLLQKSNGSTITEELRKSHVSSYTRKDGTVVKEHDDKRIKTKNEGYGYHGEIYRDASEHGFGEKAQDVAADHFHTAAKAVMKHGGVGEIDARNYLDSKYGRHLHDEVSNRVGRHEGMPTDPEKGHHPDVINRHIEPAIKEHFDSKWAKKNMAAVVKDREYFE